MLKQRTPQWVHWSPLCITSYLIFYPIVANISVSDIWFGTDFQNIISMFLVQWTTFPCKFQCTYLFYVYNLLVRHDVWFKKSMLGCFAVRPVSKPLRGLFYQHYTKPRSFQTLFPFIIFFLLFKLSCFLCIYCKLLKILELDEVCLLNSVIVYLLR